MSLFTSFNAGVSGLQSSQAGLNTTAHNLANTKTQGYTRQQNINKDTYYQTIKMTTNSALQVGYGTTIATIRQIRNEFLDKEYRKEVSRQTFYEVQYNTATEIEDILGETEGVEFNDVLSDIWQTVQDLSSNHSLYIPLTDLIKGFLHHGNHLHFQVPMLLLRKSLYSALRSGQQSC